MDDVNQDRTLRFPTSAGVLLGAALCAHLGALVQATVGEPTTGATLFLVGQAALSFALIRLIDGDWMLQDIRFFFVLFVFLYGGTLPLIAATENHHNQGIMAAAFLYGTALLGFNLVQWWYKVPWRDISPSALAKIRPNRANLLIMLGIFAFMLAYAYARGLRLALTIDRTQLRFLGTQLWVVIQFAMNGAAMYMFAGWSNLRPGTRRIVALTVAAFVLVQLSFGNRRDFLQLLIFIVAVAATRRQAVIRVGTVIAGSIAFGLFLMVALVRQIIQYPSLLLAKSSLQLILESNEFVSPIQTLMHYATHETPLRWGWTYITAPWLFIPRAIWTTKPRGLSSDFLRDAFGYLALQGYAYTPVTEAFLNFGWVGPFFIFCVLSLLMVKLVRHADGYPGLYLICFALVVDFNRGEFAGIFYTLVAISATYYAMHFVSKLTWAGRVPSARLRALQEVRASGHQPAPTS